MSEKTIAERFKSDDMQRQTFLHRARTYSAYTNPTILPREEDTDQMALEQTYQSIGSRGLELMTGSLMVTMFPPGIPWYRHNLLPDIRFDSSLPDDQIQQSTIELANRDLTIHGALEASNMRRSMRSHIESILACGNGLVRLDNDMRFTAFRLDQWVTRRDSSGQVYYTIVKESVDPLSLTEEQLRKSGLDVAELSKQVGPERAKDIYTMAEWQPLSKKWVTTQEINDNVVEVDEGKTSAILPPSQYIPVPGSDYGRGFVELHIGDLRTFNGLSEALYIASEFLSMMKMVIDQRSRLRLNELVKKDGKPIYGFVTPGNEIDGVAFLRVDKSQDLGFVAALAENVGQRLSRSFMLESNSQPSGERVTAFQVGRIAAELEKGLGGVYSALSDDIQKPLLERVIEIMTDNKQLEEFKKSEQPFEIEFITGQESVSRTNELNNLLAVLRSLGQMPADLASKMSQRINEDEVWNRLLSLTAIDPNRMIKSDDQVRQEQQGLVDQQLAQQINSRAVDAIGNAVEGQATAA